VPQPLSFLKDRYAVCRLPPDAEVPDWVADGELLSITRTANELSILCASDGVPEEVVAEHGWVAARVAGQLDFSAIGILSSILDPLTTAGIPVFVVSTFDTDYILVRHTALGKAIHALESAGHLVSEPSRLSSRTEEGVPE
jgi:hypothetical protein